MRKLLTSAVVALGLATSSFAQAASPVRASAPATAAENRLAGDSTLPLIMALIIAVGTILAIDETDSSDSP